MTLTNREKEVLLALSTGASNQQIADQLVLSLYTVKGYVKNIYAKLNARNRAHAIVIAQALGLLEPTPPADSAPPLPELIAPLFGRSEEQLRLADLFQQPHVRLVTIVGIGGVGKTHLALSFAHTSADQFPDGVHILRLLPVQHAEAVWTLLASIFDTDDDRDSLLASLSDRRALLVLDNCEHLPDLPPLVLRLLSQTGTLKVLATSRRALNLPNEHRLLLGGLDDAAALFIHHAQRADPTFLPTSEDRATIGGICQAVGDLPLAVQLAAAWVTALPLNAILAQLHDNALRLEHHLHDPLAQARNLQAVLADTWALLAEDESNALMACAIFAAGISSAAMAAFGIRAALLARLVEKSVLEWHPAQHTYALHPLLRQYARQQLDASGATATAFDRLEAFVEDLLAQDPILDHAWLIDLHQADVEAVIQAALDHGKTDMALRLLNRLSTLWIQQGRSQALLYWFRIITEYIQPNPTDTPPKNNTTANPENHLENHFENQKAIGELYEHAARIGFGQLDHAVLLDWFHHARRHYQQARYQVGELRIDTYIAHILMHHHADFEQARAIHQRNLAMGQQIESSFIVMTAWHGLGLVASETGDFEGAIGYFQDALNVVQTQFTTHKPHQEADLFINLGVCYLKLEQYAVAETYFEVALDRCRVSGFAHLIALIQANLGEVRLKQGRYQEAEALHQAALLAFATTDYQLGILHQLEMFGYLRGAAGRPNEAARYLGAAAQIRERTANPRTPREQADYDRYVAAIQAQLSAADFTAYFQQGHALPLVQVVQELVADRG